MRILLTSVITSAIIKANVTAVIKMEEEKIMRNEGVITKEKRLGFLGTIERVGNKLPHPFVLFLYIIAGLIAITTVMSFAGVSVINPKGEEVFVRNLLSKDGLIWILSNLLKNFSGFAPLGLVLAMQLAVGFSEQTGLLPTFLRKAILDVPIWALSATVIFFGINGSIASEAAIVIIPALAAAAFQAKGKNPIVGLIAGYAATNAGFTASIIVAGTDVLLAGVTQEAAQIIDPSITVNPAMNWYFMIFSTIILTVVGMWVSDKIIAPKLGTYKGAEVATERQITDVEKKGLRNAGIFTLVIILLLAIMVVPSNGILRDAQTGSIVPSPFLDGLVAILILYFILVGLVYGKTVGTIKSANEIPAKMAEAVAPLTGYIVLVFVIAQFIAMFNYTNLGMVIAVNGAKVLKSAGLTGIPLMISMILMTTFVNLFMSSGSAKWYIFAPIFVPMFMMLGYSPAFAQIVYRIGDSATNPITPIYAYMPIIIGMAQKYDKNVGMGTIISLMLPYTLAFLGVWILQMIVWVVFNIPLGPGAALFL